MITISYRKTVDKRIVVLLAVARDYPSLAPLSPPFQ